jgi:glycosyltransferase involved in cell wall biosynthesis
LPKVSVILSAYNSSSYIEQSVNSILEQTFKDFEFFIIDDGSKDNTLGYLQQLNDPRIRLIIHQENKGLIYSLNEGFDLASGEYIARMDADDISICDRLERQVAFLDTNPEIGVLGGNMKWMHNGHDIPKPITHHGICCWQLFHTCFSHPTVVMRTSVIKKHGIRYNPQYIHAEDYEIWNQLSHVTRLANLRETLLYYRRHSGQVSNLHQEVQVQSAKKIHLVQLSKIGIIPSEEEYKLHIQFAQFQIPLKGVEHYSKAIAWARKILQNNRYTHVYDELTLLRVLSRCFTNSGYYSIGYDEAD